MTTTIDQLTINRHGVDERLDRRVKLTTEDKQNIREQYFNARMDQRPTQTALAADYNVSRRLIEFILFPEREARQKEQARIRQKDGRYYDKERGRQNMREYREYKRTLVKEGKLIEGL